MKFLFPFAILLCLLQSCTTYYFTTPQPAGGEKLAEIPENLRGTWNCTYDSVGERKCLEDGGYFISANQVILKDKSEIFKSFTIGQNAELLKLESYYVFNILESNKMADNKGKEIKKPLYSTIVLTETEGSISLWQLHEPWSRTSAKKIRRKAQLLVDPNITDTTNYETKVLLNFSLTKKDLVEITSKIPYTMFTPDSTILSENDLLNQGWYSESAGGYGYCGEPDFELESDINKFYRLEDRIFRLYEKQTKLREKEQLRRYKNAYTRAFGNEKKGYAIMLTYETYSDTSAVKNDYWEYLYSDSGEYIMPSHLNEVYRLVEFDRDELPNDYSIETILMMENHVPLELARELISLKKISFVSCEGVIEWHHLSESDKAKLRQYSIVISESGNNGVSRHFNP